jgi:tetratricopeptide (TPR) repeat protein
MQNDSNRETYAYPARDGARARRNTGVTAFLLAALLLCVSGAVAVPGGLGLLAGYQELQTHNHEAAIIHFNRGLSFLAEKYPELARSEFETALKYDPAFEPAREKLTEAQTPNGGATPGAPQQDRISVAMFDEARGLIAQKEWSDAITRLEQLRTLNPNYRTAEVNELLYQAYLSSAQAAVSSGQIEIARERFESALAIRNTDAEIKRQRDLAVLYLEGQQAFGYNWQTAVTKLSALYQQDPNYGDVKKRLYDAHIQYGDKACKEGAWALAQREYDGALALVNDPQLAQKRTQAPTICKRALTPTPADPPVIVGTPAITGTLAPSGTPTLIALPIAESYTWVTSTARDKPCTGAGTVSGAVRDALGRALANVLVGYYADDIRLASTRTNANGQYQLTVTSKDPRVLHVVILGADGNTPISLSADVHYPGGLVTGCHIVIEWQRVQ